MLPLPQSLIPMMHGATTRCGWCRAPLPTPTFRNPWRLVNSTPLLSHFRMRYMPRRPRPHYNGGSTSIWRNPWRCPSPRAVDWYGRGVPARSLIAADRVRRVIAVRSVFFLVSTHPAPLEARSRYWRWRIGEYVASSHRIGRLTVATRCWQCPHGHTDTT